MLWVRPNRKDWDSLVVDEEERMHVYLIEYGLRVMPPGVDSFCVVADSQGMGISQVNPALMKSLLQYVSI